VRPLDQVHGARRSRLLAAGIDVVDLLDDHRLPRRCMRCHMSQERQDFVFTVERMESAK